MVSEEDKRQIDVNLTHSMKFISNIRDGHFSQSLVNSPFQSPPESPLQTQKGLLPHSLLQSEDYKKTVFGPQISINSPDSIKLEVKHMDPFETTEFEFTGVNNDDCVNIQNKENPIDEQGEKKMTDSKPQLSKEKMPILRQNLSGFPTRALREENEINISFWEYLKSYLWKTSAVEEKIGLLREGMRRIDERLDIFNMFKKFREIDKLKLLLLESDQLVLFNGLPKPVLVHKGSDEVNRRNSMSFSHAQLREAKFVNEDRMNKLMVMSYLRLKDKTENTAVEKKLLEIYDNIFDAHVDKSDY